MDGRSSQSLVIALAYALLFTQPAHSQPLGQDIVISPPALGTATWHSSTQSWSVAIDGLVGNGDDQSVYVTGVESLAGDRPSISTVDVTCPGTAIHVFLHVANVYAITHVTGNLPGSYSHMILSACETQYWIGTVGVPDSVDVDKINSMSIGTDLRGGLVAPEGIAGVEVGSNFYGDLDTDGDLEYLSIGRKLAKNSSLDLATFTVGDSVNYLAAGEIHANISVGGSGDGRVSTILADKGSGGSFSGEFEGSLDAVDLRESGTTPTNYASYVYVAGDLNADLYFEQEIADDNDGDPVIVVDGDLIGQVVINGSDSAYDWEGTVAVGSTTLGPDETGDQEGPYYGVLSTTLGGGAVGLVPFNFHPKDSAPDHDSVVSGGAPTSVTLDHYGPVIEGDDQDSEPAVRVFEAPAYFPMCSSYDDHADVPLCWKKCPSGTV